MYILLFIKYMCNIFIFKKNLFIFDYLNIDQNKLFVIWPHWQIMDDSEFCACKKKHRLSIARKVGSSNTRWLYLVVNISCRDSLPTSPISHWFGQQRRNANIRRHRRDVCACFAFKNFSLLQRWQWSSIIVIYHSNLVG